MTDRSEHLRKLEAELIQLRTLVTPVLIELQLLQRNHPEVAAEVAQIIRMLKRKRPLREVSQ